MRVKEAYHIYRPYIDAELVKFASMVLSSSFKRTNENRAAVLCDFIGGIPCHRCTHLIKKTPEDITHREIGILPKIYEYQENETYKQKFIAFYKTLARRKWDINKKAYVIRCIWSGVSVNNAVKEYCIKGNYIFAYKHFSENTVFIIIKHGDDTVHLSKTNDDSYLRKVIEGKVTLSNNIFNNKTLNEAREIFDFPFYLELYVNFIHTNYCLIYGGPTCQGGA